MGSMTFSAATGEHEFVVLDHNAIEQRRFRLHGSRHTAREVRQDLVQTVPRYPADLVWPVIVVGETADGASGVMVDAWQAAVDLVQRSPIEQKLPLRWISGSAC